MALRHALSTETTYGRGTAECWRAVSRLVARARFEDSKPVSGPGHNKTAGVGKSWATPSSHRQAGRNQKVASRPFAAQILYQPSRCSALNRPWTKAIEESEDETPTDVPSASSQGPPGSGIRSRGESKYLAARCQQILVERSRSRFRMAFFSAWPLGEASYVVLFLHLARTKVCMNLHNQIE